MNLAFDPVAGAQIYAEMESEELVRIAYLEPDYVPAAVKLWGFPLVSSRRAAHCCR